MALYPLTSNFEGDFVLQLLPVDTENSMDEVAAAAIRYPLGLAGALRKCSRQVVPAGSFFLTPNYDQGRWVWFDIWSDRKDSNLSDLDDVELRALALEEW